MFNYVERDMVARNDFPVKNQRNAMFIYQQGIQAQFLFAPDFGKMNRPQPITAFFWRKRKK